LAMTERTSISRDFNREMISVQVNRGGFNPPMYILSTVMAMLIRKSTLFSEFVKKTCCFTGEAET